MIETRTLGLPLLSPAQAQKHVTVNEALVRLDALSQLTLASRSALAPPASPLEGDVYWVGAGAGDAWTGADGNLAIWLNGGWVFVAPKAGWRAHVADEAADVTFDGTTWVDTAGGTSAALPSIRAIEIDHDIAAGPTTETLPVIPTHSVVFAVTARVLVDIGGTLTGWRIGVTGADDRYGTGYGLATGSWARGLTSSPLVYWGDTPLLLTAEAGEFASGRVRLAVHVFEPAIPDG